mmetsp:Transcript_3483/g.6632  ORF Transcript_3483/g.6632 Transcript_3483/m.6632 type:complete len:268 (+) Transcript_3483:70-873(+)
MPNAQLRTNRYAALLSDSSGQEDQETASLDAHPSRADRHVNSDRGMDSGKCVALEGKRLRKRKRCKTESTDGRAATHEPEQEVRMKRGRVKKQAESQACENDTSLDKTVACAADVSQADAARPKMVGGVKVQVLRQATPGATVAALGSEVRCLYQGRLPAKDNKVFDAGEVDFVIGDGQVVRGFDLGIRGMCVGERRLLQVPSKLGYGKKGRKSKVPPYSDLVFDITLTHAEVDWANKFSTSFMECAQRRKESREAALRRRKKPRQP